MHHERGITIMLVLAFMGIFTLVLGAITSYSFMQARYGRALFAREQAFQIAEAGLEHFRWYLAHNPGILETGQGMPNPMSYVVEDPEAGRIGEATIMTVFNTSCEVPQYLDVYSEGRADRNPSFVRTLAARYTRQSVAGYSFIVNQNVWAGSDRVITGPFHSNGGVRMDGSNNADVTSSVATWICDATFGCDPTDNATPGVFGSGSGSALWRYPVPQISFDNIGSDYAMLKGVGYARGMYFSGTTTRSQGSSQGASHASVNATDRRGYHVRFNADGSVSVYRVSNTVGVSGYNANRVPQWGTDYDIIQNEHHVGTFTPPGDCPVIYMNSKTWIDGTVSGKYALIVADTGPFAADVILNGNLSYATTDGTSGLTVIAERDIRIPLVSPDQMSIRGIFIAQEGYFGRNYYTTSGSNQVPAQYDAYVERDSLTTIGTVVSNQRVGTKWLCGTPGTFCSGYETRTDSYDRVLAFSPPPFTPFASEDYEITLWREE